MALKKDALTPHRGEDEQIIYIDPAENITSVRQRLEYVSTPNVTLVVPPQTQLRSHLAWRLLQKRAEEMGLQVTIVSADQQICAIARSLRFKAAASLYETPTLVQPRTRSSTRSSKTKVEQVGTTSDDTAEGIVEQGEKVTKTRKRTPKKAT